MVIRAPFIQKLEENNIREGFLEYEQYRTLLDALPPHLKALYVVGYHVGARSGELRSVQKPHVDIAGGLIRLSGQQTKNGRPRSLPIYGDIRAWVDMQITDLDQNWPGCPWLFHYQGRRIGAHLKGWGKACAQEGLPGLRFHDLRRSAIRNMERAGIPRHVAMQISGHRTESVYRRYDIVSSRDLSLAASRMENYFANLPQAGTTLGTLLGTPEGKLQ